MPEVHPVGFKLLGSIKGNRQHLRDYKFQLARKLDISPRSLGHCIDGVPHEDFGHNRRFIVMKEKTIVGPKVFYLAKENNKGSIEVVSSDYLGSVKYVLSSRPGKSRLAHFYTRTYTKPEKGGLFSRLTRDEEE